MYTSKGISMLATLVIATAVAMPVMAQSTEIEGVVVTARKRDESFQDVPVTVNVFTEATIASAGIQKPGDFIALVPNMTLVETQNAGNAFVVVRGISQARNSEPSVAVLVDGVLETNPAEFNQELFDIQQIEVLKGPQGALYGRNAIGGAIIIRTKDPSGEFEGTRQGRRRQWLRRQGPGRGQRADGASDALDIPRLRELLRHGRLHSEHLPRRQGGSGRGPFRPAALPVEAERHVYRRPAPGSEPTVDPRAVLRHSARRRARIRSARSSRRRTPTTSLRRSRSTTPASTTATCSTPT